MEFSQRIKHAQLAGAAVHSELETLRVPNLGDYDLYAILLRDVKMTDLRLDSYIHKAPSLHTKKEQASREEPMGALPRPQHLLQPHFHDPVNTGYVLCSETQRPFECVGV